MGLIARTVSENVTVINSPNKAPIKPSNPLSIPNSRTTPGRFKPIARSVPISLVLSTTAIPIVFNTDIVEIVMMITKTSPKMMSNIRLVRP